MMVDQRKAILVRISPELADALQRWARDELRSVSAQIEYLLREAVRKRTGRPPDADRSAHQLDEGGETR